MSELSTLFTEDKVIELAGTKIKIKQLETQHLQLALTIAEKVIGSLQGKDNKEIVANICGAIARDMKLVNGLIESLTDLEKGKIQRLNLAALTLILKEIVEVNFDFLFHNMRPVLESFKDLGEKYRGQEKSKD